MKKSDYAKLYTLRSDGRYQGYWKDELGIRHALCDRDPEALHRKLEAKKNPPAPTFKDAADRWEVEHVEQLARSTQATYRAPLAAVVDRLGSRPVAEITAGDINRILLEEKQRGYSYKHCAATKSICKMIFDYAIVQGWITVNPTAAVTVPRGMQKGKILAPEAEIEKIICANFDKPFGDFAAVLYYAGLRTEEAAALQWGDVDNPPGFLSISRAADLMGTPRIKDTKTEAGAREVPIMAQLRPFLTPPPGAKPTDLIFHDGAGKLLSRGKIATLWLSWCKAAGLAEQRTYTERHRGKKTCTRTEWRPLVKKHQLRHGFAVAMLEAGVDELTTQTWIGHKDASTTHEIYMNLRKKHAEEQLKKLQQHFNGGTASAGSGDGSDTPPVGNT